LKVPPVLADLMFTGSLFQRTVAATEKERDDNVVVASGWCRSVADERKFLVG